MASLVVVPFSGFRVFAVIGTGGPSHLSRVHPGNDRGGPRPDEVRDGVVEVGVLPPGDHHHGLLDPLRARLQQARFTRIPHYWVVLY
eukprot:4508431-Pyramimonas_sp.AAC.1